MKKTIYYITIILLSHVSLFTVNRIQAQENGAIEIKRRAAGEQVPITIEGLSGEALQTLEFDLDIMGFEIVEKEKAQYLIKGKPGENLQAVVSDTVTGAPVLSKAYSGGSVRAQAHALSDNIVEAILGERGIAQTTIAFKVDFGLNSEIYISDYDGHNAIAVTSDHSVVAAPCWVPGQRALYYTSYKNGNPDIYYHALSLGLRKPVARFLGLNTSVAVSPDGNRLAMILSKSGSPDLFVSDADGNNLKQLTKTKASESSPAWSPDGQTVCFVSRVTGRAALYTISSGGGEMQRLRAAGISNATEPAWSPDGKTIAFTAQMGGFNICTVPATGGTATILVGGEDPSWAPNSSTLIFTKRTATDRYLCLLDVPTKEVKNIARVSGDSSQPSWAK
ncbi:MAG: hypothetical protein K9N48_03840 [Verrucomicrobia bacterium]|nr:hypothetical protein [Verrucomicrobiota bacterium]MCF7708979.1 hypothetical protein [Verrucomicrobiota bacterium]